MTNLNPIRVVRKTAALPLIRPGAKADEDDDGD